MDDHKWLSERAKKKKKILSDKCEVLLLPTDWCFFLDNTIYLSKCHDLKKKKIPLGNNKNN